MGRFCNILAVKQKFLCKNIFKIKFIQIEDFNKKNRGISFFIIKIKFKVYQVFCNLKLIDNLEFNKNDEKIALKYNFFI